MNIEDFEHLSEREVDYMADKVRSVFDEMLDDLHALRLTYLETNWADQEDEREVVIGRMDFMDSIATSLVEYGSFPSTVEGMVGLYEEFEEDLRGLSTRVGGYHPATWTYWRGYQKAGASLMTSLEEAMEVEEADPNGYSD